MKEEDILKKLLLLGINNSEQLEKHNLNYWWRIKYKENQDDNLTLSKLDKTINELEQFSKDELISTLLNQQINLLKEKDRNIKKRLNFTGNDLQDKYIANDFEETEKQSEISEKEEKLRQLAEQIKKLNDQDNILIEKEEELNAKCLPLKQRRVNLDRKLMTLRIDKNWKEIKESESWRNFIESESWKQFKESKSGKKFTELRREFTESKSWKQLLKQPKIRRTSIKIVIWGTIGLYSIYYFGNYGLLLTIIISFSYKPILKRFKFFNK